MPTLKKNPWQALETPAPARTPSPSRQGKADAAQQAPSITPGPHTPDIGEDGFQRVKSRKGSRASTVPAPTVFVRPKMLPEAPWRDDSLYVQPKSSEADRLRKVKYNWEPNNETGHIRKHGKQQTAEARRILKEPIGPKVPTIVDKIDGSVYRLDTTTGIRAVAGADGTIKTSFARDDGNIDRAKENFRELAFINKVFTKRPPLSILGEETTYASDGTPISSKRKKLLDSAAASGGYY